MERMKGKVTRVLRDKGFGFITGDDRHSRFMHARDAREFDIMTEGDEVEFTPAVVEPSGDRKHNGLRATEVVRVGKPT